MKYFNSSSKFKKKLPNFIHASTVMNKKFGDCYFCSVNFNCKYIYKIQNAYVIPIFNLVF